MRAYTIPTTVGPRAAVRHYVLAVLLALGGGIFGIIGAFVQEARAGGSFVLIIVGAPVIEELLKPAGIYLVLARWPSVGRSQLFIAVLAGLAGLSFGLIESTIYVTVYAPDQSQAYFIYRFTVTVLVHVVASFTAGLGISAELLGWAHGRNRLPRRTLLAFIAAMVIHGLYNTTALGLALAGVLDFD